MQADQIRDLIARLEAAGRGSYALEHEINRVVRGAGTLEMPPAFTVSIDDAFLLVPNDWRICDMRQPDEVWFVDIVSQTRLLTTQHRSLSIALVIASLRARLSQTQQEAR